MYRLWQLMRALTGRVRREEWALVKRLLTSSQLALFRSMSRRDQRHGIDLVRTLQRQGYGDPALLQAALLHDVGKAGYLRLWHRVAVAVGERFAPAMLPRLADDQRGSWRYPFFAHLNHPRLGAERAKEAGCDWLTLELIRRHHERVSLTDESESDRLLAALQAADGQV